MNSEDLLVKVAMRKIKELKNLRGKEEKGEKNEERRELVLSFEFTDGICSLLSWAELQNQS